MPAGINQDVAEDKSTAALKKNMKEFKSVTDWTVQAVGDYVANSGFPDLAPKFMAHKIDGSVLYYLGREELIEVGVTCVGDRLKIQRQIGQLQTQARAEFRNAVTWEALESRVTCCLGWEACFGFPCCWCQPPREVYRLTRSSLRVEYYDLKNNCCGMWCGGRLTIDNWELETIVDVDTATDNPRACTVCDYPRSSVEVTNRKDSVVRMFLKIDEADAVQQAIRDAVAEAKIRIMQPGGAGLAML
eukprot:CAMPEP_0197532466 /NCGR_PEP_ID=MMETSP1318-20131121/39795_1 /TAXON_ID=552666 /ORGANISM="Partenskyella glossopodia, Strain RCC365" /LENGTH=244 /DNA_ID=CAMNT_0043089033 /DNA_START=70 /DNA_END=804 /DNA_ORIENTATION=-